MIEPRILSYAAWEIVYRSQAKRVLSTPLHVLNEIMRKFSVTRTEAKKAIKDLIDTRWLTYAVLGVSCLAINAPDVWPWSKPVFWDK